jgi:hypothetical protein
MKPTRQNKMLGIAVGEKSMLVSEVQSASDTPQVTKAVEFTYPEGNTLAKDAQSIGAAFRAFLKEKGFIARNAVFGLPAKWVLSKQKDVPALEDSLLADTLRLQAESEFSTELGDLIYDYAGLGATGESAGTTSVLLLAVPKRYVDQITQLAEAARVRVMAITPFSAAIVAASKAAANGMTLVLGPSGVEFTTQQDGHPRLLRYVGGSTESAPMLMGELRRASTRTGVGASAAPEIFIWNDSGADESQIQSIGKSLELGVRDGQLGDLGVSAAPGVMNGRDFASSISLAVLGIAPAAGTPDFLDSRLAPPPEKRIDRRTLAGVVVGVLVLGLVGYWYVSLQKEQGRVDVLKQQNDARKADRETADAAVKKIKLAQHWHGEKPKFVACLTDLTEVAPQTSDIYGTSFNLADDESSAPAASAAPGTPAATAGPKTPMMKGKLQGKATNDNVIYTLVKKLKESKSADGNPKFRDVNLRDMHSSDNKGQREIVFTIEFNYLPK